MGIRKRRKLRRRLEHDAPHSNNTRFPAPGQLQHTPGVEHNYHATTIHHRNGVQPNILPHRRNNAFVPGSSFWKNVLDKPVENKYLSIVGIRGEHSTSAFISSVYCTILVLYRKWIRQESNLIRARYKRAVGRPPLKPNRNTVVCSGKPTYACCALRSCRILACIPGRRTWYLCAVYSELSTPDPRVHG